MEESVYFLITKSITKSCTLSVHYWSIMIYLYLYADGTCVPSNTDHSEPHWKSYSRLLSQTKVFLSPVSHFWRQKGWFKNVNGSVNIILKKFDWIQIYAMIWAECFFISILDSSKHCLFSVFWIQGLYLSNHVFIIYLFIFPSFEHWFILTTPFVTSEQSSLS